MVNSLGEGSTVANCQAHLAPHAHPTTRLTPQLTCTHNFDYPTVSYRTQVVADLQAQLAQQSALLSSAQGDLSRDEQIFAEKFQEVARLQSQLAAAVDKSRGKEQEMASRMQAMHTELRRCVRFCASGCNQAVNTCSSEHFGLCSLDTD